MMLQISNELIILIGPLCLAVTAWMLQRWVARQEDTLTRLDKKIDALTEQRASCTRQFADKEENRESHARIYKRIETVERELAEIKGKTEKP